MAGKHRCLRLGDAAKALDIPVKTIRNYIDRRQYTPLREQSEGWAEFTVADIAVLAVARRLINEVDFPAGQAFGLAGNIIQKSIGPKIKFSEFINERFGDARALLISLAGKYAFIYRAKGNWTARVESSLDACVLDFGIVIDVGLVARSALNRTSLVDE